MNSTLLKKPILLILLVGFASNIYGQSPSWIQPVSLLQQESSEVEMEELEFEDPFEEPIETERHDFTQSVKVVGQGVVQFEYGYLFTSNREGGERETSHSTPELLMRVGLSDSLEFRTRAKYGWKFREAEENGSGLTDVVFAMKQVLSKTEPWSLKPATAIEYRLSTPVGSSDFTSGTWKGGIDVIYEWELGERITFAGSTGGNQNGLGEFAFFNEETSRDDDFIAWTTSMALGSKLTDRSTGYFEWFGIFTHGREEEKSLNFLNVGVDYLLNNNALLDVRVGWGLNEQSDDLFAGIGGAFRF